MARRQTSTDSNSSNQSESSSASSSCSRVRMRKTFSTRPKSVCTFSQLQQLDPRSQSDHSARTSTVTAPASPSKSTVLENRKSATMSLTTPERRRVSRQKAVNKWTPKEISWPPEISRCWPVISINMWHNYLKPSLLHFSNCTIFCSFNSLPYSKYFINYKMR